MSKKITRRAETAAAKLSVHPVLARIYATRGIASEQDLQSELTDLLPWQQLLGIETAVQLLHQALQQQQSILIIGDFDADGATSTAIAIKALRSFGAKNVNFLVPNRFKYGYGLTPEIVLDAQAYQPNLIITVDNGIASHQGVQQAKALNINVLITDHHLPGGTLPEADAIVNPNQAQDLFPSKNLAGCGVIFYVMLALRQHLRQQNWFVDNNLPEPNMATLLDLVALGTVADVVPLDKNNRILVRHGLKRIQQQKCCPGILALLEVARREPARLQAMDLGFTVGPRLNAAGRIDDMTIGINCLLSDDLNLARPIATQLNSLNQERQAIEASMQHQAMQTMQTFAEATTSLPAGICLYDETWHQGVIGILAGRIKDKFHRPCIAMAKVSEQELKGSARSIPGFHMRDCLDFIATRHPDMLSKFGGHAMAAGLSIKPEHFARFARVFNATVEKFCTSDMLNHLILTDGELSKKDFSIELADLLVQAGPWGTGFPAPVFDGKFEILQQTIVGQKHLKLILSMPNEMLLLPAIAFSVDTQRWPNHDIKNIQAAYRLDINEYQGLRKVQLVIEHFEPC